MDSGHNIILETERLFLREFKLQDAADLYRLNLDPDVLKYTGDKPFDNIDEAGDFILNYDQYRKYGFGRWAVSDKSEGRFLGWCGLKFTPETNEHDIGFRFMKQFWNQGYATESAAACLDFGFSLPQIKTIIGRAARENTASIKVLQKIGLSYYKDAELAGYNAVIYKIDTKML